MSEGARYKSAGPCRFLYDQRAQTASRDPAGLRCAGSRYDLVGLFFTRIRNVNTSFKANQIPAGEVTIVLEKKGYKTYRREGVILKPGMSIKLNFDIKSDDEDSEVFHPLLRMMEGG